MPGDLHLTITDPRNVQKIVALSEGTYTVGADDSNQVVLADSSVSWRHAILSNAPDGIWIEDLKSITGSYLDGSRVRDRVQVGLGQRMQIGGYVLSVSDPNAAEQSVAESKPRPEPEPDPEVAEKPEAALSAMPRQPLPTSVTMHQPQMDPPKAPNPAMDPERQARLDRRQKIKRQIHTELLERLDLKRLTANQVGEDDLRDRAKVIIEQIIHDVADRLPAGIPPSELTKEVYDEALGLGPLEPFLADPEVTEIMVNGHQRIYVEKAGKLFLTDAAFIDSNSTMAVIERIVAPIGRRIDESQPYVDARLADGSRVNAIIPPLSLSGPVITIRKFSRDPFTAEQLVQMGAVSKGMIGFIDSCVKLRKNIIISGGTGTGKTTFLNVVSGYLPDNERILTVEDAAELRLTQDHVVKLEARPANIEGKGAIPIRDLVRNALRMRPDRIVVGECRGGEALDMLQAMNTGHEGSITTVHANTPRDCMARLETMVLMAGMDLPLRAIREQIGSAIQLVIQLSRFPDGTRKVTKLTEVTGMEGEKIVMQDLFEFKQTGLGPDGKVLGGMVPTGAVPTFLDEFRVRGMHVDANVFNPESMI